MRGPASLGGISTDRPSRGDTPLAANWSFIPASSGASLKDFKISDAFRDKVSLIFAALFVSSLSIFFGVATYVFFFWSQSGFIP